MSSLALFCKLNLYGGGGSYPSRGHRERGGVWKVWKTIEGLE